MPKGIFLTVKDVMTVEGIQTERHAWRVLQTIKDSLKKSREQKVTITEYAKYRGVALSEIKQALAL